MPDRMDPLLRRVEKPGRYVNHEWNSAHKPWDAARVRLLLAYPDTYEVGMSNLGLQVLYDIANRRADTLAERAYAPWADFEAQLRASGERLRSLESGRALSEFDLVGFSLGSELTYTNLLNMLDLGGIPLRSAGRGDGDPVVIAGGACVYNPEPLADYVDLFVIGEAEEALAELLALAAEGMRPRAAFLRRAARIPGVYVPALYEVAYGPGGAVTAVTPNAPEAPARVSRRVYHGFGSDPGPLRPIVPNVEAVHDRAMIEIQRGCTRGCRFCQAGTIYRPLRERGAGLVQASVEEILAATGYDEISLVSLSTADHSHIEEIVGLILAGRRGCHASVSLPSLRTDSFSVKLAEMVSARRRSGLTFAPEAGTQRLRDVINKGVTEEDLLTACDAAFSRGWKRVKLYFMVGLPTETDEDVEGIVRLVRRVRDLGRARRGRGVEVSVSAATLIPKPHTPFQWVAQARADELNAKQGILLQGLRGSGVRVSWHNPQDSLLEAVLSRGDRRLGPVIERVWRAGGRFDAWSEHFDWSRWAEALEAEGLDPSFYAHRERPADEVFPWDHIDGGVSKPFLWREYQRAARGLPSEDCRTGECLVCGLEACCPRHGELSGTETGAR